MLNIFEYTDFRKYLIDYYEYQKKEGSRFSYRLLSTQTGMNPGNFTKMLKGERNLPVQAAIQISYALNHNKKEKLYFQAMVLFCQAKSHEDKRRHFEELMTFKESSVRVLDASHYMFYDKWYYTAVRESLAFFPLYDDNFGKLGKTIIPPITENQVASAVKLLTELNLIKKDEYGRYNRTDVLLSTGNNIKSLTLNNFILHTMKLAENAINTGQKDTNLSSVSFSISGADFEQIQEEVRLCRRKILEIARNSELPDRVYQFNIQLFPLTERYEGEGK
jgi:uncharacterized protein (TIGR02147 family)